MLPTQFYPFFIYGCSAGWMTYRRAFSFSGLGYMVPVIPAQAGIHIVLLRESCHRPRCSWIPAFAGIADGPTEATYEPSKWLFS